MIAAVSGYAVAGGLELALMCDMRVADETATFGVFCRRFGQSCSIFRYNLKGLCQIGIFNVALYLISSYNNATFPLTRVRNYDTQVATLATN